MLHLGEDLLDRVEVWGVGREECEPRSCRHNRIADSARAVTAEIVDDDDVTRRQARHQELFDIGAEQSAIDRAVDHTRRKQRIDPQGGQERQRLPAAVGREALEALTFRPPAADRRHVGLDPRLIDENEARGIEMRHGLAPSPAPPHHVDPVLLSRQQCFFEAQIPPVSESAKPCRARR